MTTAEILDNIRKKHAIDTAACAERGIEPPVAHSALEAHEHRGRLLNIIAEMQKERDAPAVRRMIDAQAWALLQRARVALCKVAPQNESDAMDPPSWADVDALRAEIGTTLAGLPATETSRAFTRVKECRAAEDRMRCTECDQEEGDVYSEKALRRRLMLAENALRVARMYPGVVLLPLANLDLSRLRTKKPYMWTEEQIREAWHKYMDSAAELEGAEFVGMPKGNRRPRVWTETEIREAFGQYMSEETIGACLAGYCGHG